jgi:hypothetical protein
VGLQAVAESDFAAATRILDHYVETDRYARRDM